MENGQIAQEINSIMEEQYEKINSMCYDNNNDVYYCSMHSGARLFQEQAQRGLEKQRQ